jgi:hypothetical protein
MRKLLSVCLLVCLAVQLVRAQDPQVLQPADSLEQRRAKINSNFSLLDLKLDGINLSTHTHANKVVIDLFPSTLPGTANILFGVSSTGNAVEMKQILGGTGISISHGAGSITISASGTGITSLNSQSQVSQTFGNDTNVQINSGGGVHQLAWAGVLAPARGGTNNAFFGVAGPSGTVKTFTFPNISAGVLTDAALVTAGQGGTGASSLTGLVRGNGGSAMTAITDSAGFFAVITNETGSGSVVGSSAPTLANPVFTTMAQFNAQAEARFADSDSSNYVGFRSPAAVTVNKIYDLPAAVGTANQMLTLINPTTGELGWTTPPGSSGGEANTASNVGAGGLGFFKQKAGVDLQFRNLNVSSARINIGLDAANNEIDIDVVEANFNLANLGGTLPVSKGGTGVPTLTGIVVASGASNFTAIAQPAGDLVGTLSAHEIFNKTFNVEATGNVFKQPYRINISAAGCNGTTASNNWDTFSTNAPTASCLSGSNIVGGRLDFPDGATDLVAMQTIFIPADWDATQPVDARLPWRSSVTSGAVVWGLSVSCADDGQVDDNAFNSYTDVTDTAKATANQENFATFSNLNMTGCAAGKVMHVRLARRLSQGADNHAGIARAGVLEMTFRRSQ